MLSRSVSTRIDRLIRINRSTQKHLCIAKIVDLNELNLTKNFLQVSSSCSSVYVDGSEARGSSNASIIVKYGTYSGLARFIVWMPEFPLEVSVTDFRLSQIKGWKIPDDMHT